MRKILFQVKVSHVDDNKDKKAAFCKPNVRSYVSSLQPSTAFGKGRKVHLLHFLLVVFCFFLSPRALLLLSVGRNGEKPEQIFVFFFFSTCWPSPSRLRKPSVGDSARDPDPRLAAFSLSLRASSDFTKESFFFRCSYTLAFVLLSEKRMGLVKEKGKERALSLFLSLSLLLILLGRTSSTFVASPAGKSFSKRDTRVGERKKEAPSFSSYFKSFSPTVFFGRDRGWRRIKGITSGRDATETKKTLSMTQLRGRSGL